MTVKVAINGYGRIGRCILRALYESGSREKIKIVGINELAGLESLVHLTRFDSTHGTFGGDVRQGDGVMFVNDDKIASDLEANWAVVAEAIQTILRREGFPKPYEALKELTRTSGAITRESIRTFISELNVMPNVKKELLEITPQNYTGQ